MLRSRLLLLLLGALFYGLLLAVPLFLILRLSFSEGLDHYLGMMSNPMLGRVVENTVVISAVATLAAVLMAYVYAAALWRSSTFFRILLFGLVLTPFWTGILIKNFAWAVILQDNGIINGLLLGLGLIDEHLSLLHARPAVIIGMIHYVLPYAVFPIYAAMIGIDSRLERAARSLGAPMWKVVLYVIIPLSLPGVYAAALLVFIISTSFFITPVILGGPREMMMANMVELYAREFVDFGGAAALAVLVTLAVSILVLVYQRLPKEGQHGLG